ncbi:MAG: MauE/DoxX family redox-associated membrane protein [Ginsengibacter sp.]
MFTTYLLYMILTKSTLPCSCGGAIQKLSWRQHIFFNTFFILISIVAIYILNYLHKQERFRTKY